MEYKMFDDTAVVRLDRGDEILSSLQKVCEKENITAGSIAGLGAVDHAIIGVFKVADKTFYPAEFNEEMELASINGNVSFLDGKPYLHLHAAFGRQGGSVVGGHLKEGRISVTGEIYIRKLNGIIGRKMDKDIGINMISF